MSALEPRGIVVPDLPDCFSYGLEGHDAMVREFEPFIVCGFSVENVGGGEVL